MKVAASKPTVIFPPWAVLLTALAGAATYGAYLLRSTSIRSHMFELSGTFMYVVPIVIPFIAFLFDRIESWQRRNILPKLIDALVVLTAMGRVVGDVPLISGHTLFLTYCILTARSRLATVMAALVMVQAMYLKYFVWHDWITSTNGIVLGCVAACIVWRGGLRSLELRRTNG